MEDFDNGVTNDYENYQRRTMGVFKAKGQGFHTEADALAYVEETSQDARDDCFQNVFEGKFAVTWYTVKD